jgi:hypothetical protein
MSLFDHFGWDATQLVFNLHTAAYVILLLYWTRVVWRPRPATLMAAAGQQQARGRTTSLTEQPRGQQGTL